MSDAGTVRVGLGTRAYDIVIGSGLLAGAAARIKTLARRNRTIVVTDGNVARHHLAALMDGFAAEGMEALPIILPPGEDQKSFAGLEHLSDALLALEVERGDIITAFGGGVIGDLTGLAAGLLKRGVDFVQIPTTLLAQVDSSVGGKTAINARAGKNLVGLFHQPRLVIADTALLKTLPARELRAGYAEIVKYGLLGDKNFFEWCEKNAAPLLACDPVTLNHAVTQSCRMKAAIVAEDEREQGRRALLNLGHTFGHALEAETGYSDRLLHGESVAIGMVLAFALAAELNLISREDSSRVAQHIAAIGLPARISDVAGLSATPETLIAHMRHDKKAKDGKLTFIVPHAIGDARIHDDVPLETVARVLSRSIAHPA